jgi:hypothetical protein
MAVRLYHQISDVDTTAEIHEVDHDASVTYIVNFFNNFDNANELVASTYCETLKDAMLVALQHMYDEMANACDDVDGELMVK